MVFGHLVSSSPGSTWPYPSFSRIYVNISGKSFLIPSCWWWFVSSKISLAKERQLAPRKDNGDNHGPSRVQGDSLSGSCLYRTPTTYPPRGTQAMRASLRLVCSCLLGIRDEGPHGGPSVSEGSLKQVNAAPVNFPVVITWGSDPAFSRRREKKNVRNSWKRLLFPVYRLLGRQHGEDSEVCPETSACLPDGNAGITKGDPEDFGEQ